MPIMHASERTLPISKYDAFIGSQLGKVGRRVRLIDVLTAAPPVHPRRH